MAARRGIRIAATLCVLSAAVIVASVLAAWISGYRYSTSASRATYTYGLLSSTALLGLFLIFLTLAARVRPGQPDALSPMALATGPVALLMTIGAVDAWALPAVDVFLVANPLINTTVIYVTSYGLPTAAVMVTLLAFAILRPVRATLPEIAQGKVP